MRLSCWQPDAWSASVLPDDSLPESETTPMDVERPAWLRSQENGTIGEARTRAFLIDRFWILERSVDVDGADLIIQRRLTSRSLLDRDAPRLGFVQAKFAQDAGTTLSVHKEYVTDPEGKPRCEFFLLCHTGFSDESQMYFLTAQNICDHFCLGDEARGCADRFVIPGAQILARKWEVTNKQRVLEQIEQALINADFSGNRRFFSWALRLNVENDSIDPQYVECIDDWYGSIPDKFFALRKRAERDAWDLVEHLDLLEKIVNTNDPAAAIDAIHRIERDFKTDLGDTDFESLVMSHQHWYEQLKEWGLLDAHAALKSRLRKRIKLDCQEHFPTSTEVFYLIDFEFDPESLEWQSFTSSVVATIPESATLGTDSTRQTQGVSRLARGKIRVFTTSRAFGAITDGEIPPSRNVESGMMWLLHSIMEVVRDQWAEGGREEIQEVAN